MLTTYFIGLLITIFVGSIGIARYPLYNKTEEAGAIHMLFVFSMFWPILIFAMGFVLLFMLFSNNYDCKEIK